MSYPALDLTDRVAVVIGATSGLGRALALGFAQAGADVVGTGRRTELVDELASAIEAEGRRTHRMAIDATSEPDLERLLAECVGTMGGVDILVNAAGITKRAPSVSMPEADWQAIMETNLNGTMRACRVFGRHMIDRRYGRIVNIASLTSHVGFYEVAAYAASKGAVAALTRSLAVEWAMHGVCVNALVPGVFRTPLNSGLLDGTARGRELLTRTPMGRFGDAEDLVGAAVFLASESARFVTGHLLAVDGGFLASGVNV